MSTSNAEIERGQPGFNLDELEPPYLVVAEAVGGVARRAARGWGHGLGGGTGIGSGGRSEG